MAESPREKLVNSGVYHFYKAVSNDSIADVTSFILDKNIHPVDDLKHLTLIVSSWGGSVYAALGLADIMEGSRLPVHTVGLGMIASAGLMIFMAGEKGRRVLTPNTQILSHQYSGIEFGKEHELIASRRANDLTSERVMTHYIKHTGLSEKEIRKNLLPAEDVWLSAKEAKKLGLCDKIKLI